MAKNPMSEELIDKYIAEAGDKKKLPPFMKKKDDKDKDKDDE